MLFSFCYSVNKQTPSLIVKLVQAKKLLNETFEWAKQSTNMFYKQVLSLYKI